jgi:hypothetical protein
MVLITPYKQAFKKYWLVEEATGILDTFELETLLTRGIRSWSRLAEVE